MKFLETHYEDYIQSLDTQNLHPKLSKLFSKFPSDINKLKNLIFYGPSGTGKYTQMLGSIRKYSATDLKYDKKISITFNKQQFFFKISDIHYEVDLALLGCNSKLLWHDIYMQIVDIISAKMNKTGIVVCKNFHEINSELLDNFYSYMQENQTQINIKYILITESVSFIPDNILNCCETIHIPRPTKAALTKCVSNAKLPLKMEQMSNIKNVHCGMSELMQPHKIICDKIIAEMIQIDELKFLAFRDMLYDIFIYNLDVGECIWYILTNLTKQGYIKNEHASKALIKTFTFFQFYNNNYRPIYHLEGYLFYLTKLMHFQPLGERSSPQTSP
jgi:hypothetical protein